MVGERTEEKALDLIKEALNKVDKLRALLTLSGPINSKRPLSKQYENTTAEPLTPSSKEQALALRSQQTKAFKDLQQLLNNEFRNEVLPI